MKYHQIEAFYQVMLSGSISKAAKNLGRTQPAVSMTIAALEEQLGASLFDRHAGRILPRAEAHVLFEQIGPLMQQLQDIRHRFRKLDTMPLPRLSVIAAANAGMHLVPSALSPIVDGGQALRIMNGSAKTIVSEMENQLHDLAVTDQGMGEIPTDSLLFEAEMFRIPVCAIFPAGLLSASGSLGIEDLTGHELCTLYERSRVGQDVRERLGAPRVEFQNLFPMACHAVAHGRIAIVDYLTCTAMQALVGGSLHGEWRVISDAAPSCYFLMRPNYKPRSAASDKCHALLRAALIAHEAPSDNYRL